MVQSVSNKMEVNDHYPVVAEPGEYMTHVTPPTRSKEKDISKEIVAVVRERKVKLRVLGMEGCSSNCGIHKGVFRQMTNRDPCLELLPPRMVHDQTSTTHPGRSQESSVSFGPLKELAS